MNNLNIYKSGSIKKLNHWLFISVILINCAFFVSERLKDYSVFFFEANFIFLVFFLVLNKLYQHEYVQQKNNIKTLNNSVLDGKNKDIKDLLVKQMKFSENEDTYKLFKNMYIRKNIIAKDYEDLKRVLLKFVPESFLNEIGNKGADKISLGLSVKKHLNVMFLDIIGFTSFTETLEPDRALLLLNVYFDGIVEIIKANGGYIDKFLGDGLMVIFDDKNSDGAVKSAIEVQKFIKKLHISEVGRNISVGIGINSGQVILGTIGSRKRMEITIIGDVVNTASRIEGLTRRIGNKIIIGENTYNTIKNKNDYTFKDLGLKSLKGKKKKIKLYGVE